MKKMMSRQQEMAERGPQGCGWKANGTPGSRGIYSVFFIEVEQSMTKNRVLPIVENEDQVDIFVFPTVHKNVLEPPIRGSPHMIHGALGKATSLKVGFRNQLEIGPEVERGTFIFHPVHGIGKGSPERSPIKSIQMERRSHLQEQEAYRFDDPTSPARPRLRPLSRYRVARYSANPGWSQVAPPWSGIVDPFRNGRQVKDSSKTRGTSRWSCRGSGCA